MGILGELLMFLWRRKLYWLVFNPRYQVQKWRSYRPSTLVDLTDEAAIRAGSLEHSRKRR